MGICLSCLRGSHEEDDDQVNSRTPLLRYGIGGSQIGSVDLDGIKRENELNQIVKETGEGLVDYFTLRQTTGLQGVSGDADVEAVKRYVLGLSLDRLRYDKGEVEKMWGGDSSEGKEVSLRVKNESFGPLTYEI